MSKEKTSYCCSNYTQNFICIHEYTKRKNSRLVNCVPKCISPKREEIDAKFHSCWEVWISRGLNKVLCKWTVLFCIRSGRLSRNALHINEDFSLALLTPIHLHKHHHTLWKTCTPQCIHHKPVKIYLGRHADWQQELQGHLGDYKDWICAESPLIMKHNATLLCLWKLMTIVLF